MARNSIVAVTASSTASRLVDHPSSSSSFAYSTSSLEVRRFKATVEFPEFSLA
jgi:hypothetical protein